MAKTFFFYDLETSGLNPRSDRIMQFAGMRATMALEIIGEPYDLKVALNDDTLPSPHAVMVTGITPQETVEEGYTEAQFAKLLTEEICTPDTIMVGFNSIRFDDEFIRHLLWRTFHDPYEWSWKEGRGRWDLLDVVRMTRALRPDGIKWPEVDGVAVNKLELIAAENNIVHEKAHDALSDVEALIAVTKLIKEKQPKLYDYLLKMSDKKEVMQLVNLATPQPFVYSSGRYDAQWQKTTVAYPLTEGKNGNVIVYDLRHDPTPLIGKSIDELKVCIYATRDQRSQPEYTPVPVKELQYNRCPAVAPLAVLRTEDWERIGLTDDITKKHAEILRANPGFADSIREIVATKPEFARQTDPEAQLYDGFLPNGDKKHVEAVRNADASVLADFHPPFSDERLSELLLHYKARNYRSALSSDEHVAWEQWRAERLRRELPAYLEALKSLASTIPESKHFLLEELQLWAEAIMPLDEVTE